MLIDQRKFQFEGIPVTYYRAGRGVPVLLLHGSGPGASSIGNWRSVLEPLAARYEVFAMDLIGFGMSGRRPDQPYFDYPLWVRQTNAMLEQIAGRQVVLIGHSLSASIALTVAAGTSRVRGVITTGAMGTRFEPNEYTRRTWTCPRSRSELEAALRGLVFDPSLINEEYLAARERVIFAPGYADYFDAMFAGDLQRYVDAAALDANLLRRVQARVLMIHGRDDLPFPPESTLGIAAKIPQADVVLLGRCSHSVAFEQTSKFLSCVTDFLTNLRSSAAAHDDSKY